MSWAIFPLLTGAGPGTGGIGRVFNKSLAETNTVHDLNVCHAEVSELCKPPTLLPGHVSFRSAKARSRISEWSDRCVTPIRTAQSISNGTIVPISKFPSVPVPSKFASDGHRESEWSFQPMTLLRALRSKEGCLVYSFGVADKDEFTDFYANMGCRVFAFDPTVQHHRQWQPNVTFYPWGLRSASRHEGEAQQTVAQYGRISGELLSLTTIMRRLGHGPTHTIHAMKLDCEGCEFHTLEELYCTAGAGPTIMSISIELHFWVALRMEQSYDLERIRYAGLYLKKYGYRTFQFRQHKGSLYPYKGELAVVHPDLIAGGVSSDTCCYMYGWVREALLSTNE